MKLEQFEEILISEYYTSEHSEVKGLEYSKRFQITKDIVVWIIFNISNDYKSFDMTIKFFKKDNSVKDKIIYRYNTEFTENHKLNRLTEDKLLDMCDLSYLVEQLILLSDIKKTLLGKYRD